MGNTDWRRYVRAAILEPSLLAVPIVVLVCSGMHVQTVC